MSPAGPQPRLTTPQTERREASVREKEGGGVGRELKWLKEKGRIGREK